MPESFSPRLILRRGPAWLAFERPLRLLEASRPEDAPAVIRQVEEATEREGLWAAGFLSYEAAPAFDSCLPSRPDPAGFPLLWFGLFGEPREIPALPPPSAGFVPPAQWESSVAETDYHERLRAIRDYLAAGDTYQVNFTWRLRARAAACDPWEFFLHLMAPAAPPYAAYVDTGEWAICSASPELLFRLEGDHIESRPMKGTAARGLWFEDDERRAAALRQSEKDRAENVMIVDMVRNDLGRIAFPGSVETPELFTVERYPTVWQMTSSVRARTREPLGRILAALFPAASITGAPKRRTMQIIRELETEPRRVYTGAIGYAAPGRQARFSVAIRTVLIHKPAGQMEYGVGGGIVWDSDPAREWEECQTKARALRPERREFDLYETLRWTPGEGFWLLEGHLRRIERSALFFGFAFDPRRAREALEAAAREFPPDEMRRARLFVSRAGACRVEASALAPEALTFGPLALAAAPVDRQDVFLYHKTTLRGVYETAHARRPPEAADVLLYNEEGEITESTVANVAVELEGALCTPPVRCGLLGGVFRAGLLERGEAAERVIRIEEALASPAVYLMNSVRGMSKTRLLPPGK